MRLRGLQVDRRWPAGDWLATGEAVDLVRAAWRAARPLADWLDTHVGRRTERTGGRGARPPAPSAEPDGTGRRGTADHESAHSAHPGEVESVDRDRGGCPRPDQEKE
jgi:hypothetical protein